jgi:hypothetical protein
MLLAATLLSATLCYSMMHYVTWRYAALCHAMLFNATVTVTLSALLNTTQCYLTLLCCGVLLNSTLLPCAQTFQCLRLWTYVDIHACSFENRFPNQRTFHYVISPNLEQAIVLDTNHEAKSLMDCGNVCKNNPNCNLFMVKSGMCLTYTVTIPADENASSISYHPPQNDQIAFFDAGKTNKV